MNLFAVLLMGMFFSFQAGATEALNPPQVIRVEDAACPKIETRLRQMASSMAVCKSGRLWAVWYGGPTGGEDQNNYVILGRSDDDGANWNEVLVVDPDGPGILRSFDPEIWVDPQGRLWFFWAQAITHGKDAHTWAIVSENPEAEHPGWTSPRVLAPGVMMCKPTILSDGTWLLPISDWEGRRLKTPEVATAGVWASTDQGLTFSLRGAALVPVEQRTYDEHMVVERKDGSIWMLVRTLYGIGESISTDGGRTWPTVTPSAIPHPAARFFISRLVSGNLLLVKHGPMTEQTGRSHLTAFISADDGQTWEGGLLLDERSSISYPDGQQAEDGRIYITYDFSRTGAKAICMAVFTEADARAAENLSGKVRLRQIVSQGIPDSVVNNSDGEALRTQPAGAWSLTGAHAYPFEGGKVLFSDRTYKVNEPPGELAGSRFLKVPLNGTKTLRCNRAGMLYVLTPRRERNKDSQTALLEQQGFKKVALPEFGIWGQKASELCTFYQKLCEEGDSVGIGKWAVPLFFE